MELTAVSVPIENSTLYLGYDGSAASLPAYDLLNSKEIVVLGGQSLEFTRQL